MKTAIEDKRDVSDTAVPTGKADQWTLPIGEVDGRITSRTHQIADVLRNY